MTGKWVSIDDISPVLIHSVIMSEDGQFCNHYGVDLGELKKVILDPRGPSPRVHRPSPCSR